MLFEPFILRGVTARNRVMVSPMGQYWSPDGLPSMWHAVHLGSRAVGGAGIVSTEATAVSREGRITACDLGLWNQTQADAFAPIARFIKEQGAVAQIQLAHSGRKGSTAEPWRGGGFLTREDGGWETRAPSSQPFDPKSPTPQMMSADEVASIPATFANSAKLADLAEFDQLELHGGHGYLLHQFLSPLSNMRTDAYGGSFENNIRLLLETAIAVRKVWPDRKTLWVRLSCTDWVEGGWDIDRSVELARRLRDLGVDAIDCSSGGLDLRQQIPLGPGYQVPFAARIRREAGIPTATVGLIENAGEAERIVASGDADVVAMARAHLRDPYWSLHAATELNVDVPWPIPYGRAKPPLLVPAG
jgi:2,4-dienoyl-CoA reductase-like NADH-dependent reductase (Old Yellow Enzyme family)